MLSTVSGDAPLFGDRKGERPLFIPKQFIADMEAAVAERFPPVGEGEDLRLTGSGIAGGALIADGHVVHLSTFRLEPELPGEEPTTRKISRSLRRNRVE